MYTIDTPRIHDVRDRGLITHDEAEELIFDGLYDCQPETEGADTVNATLESPTVSPFVFDRDYKNTEQVRPYLADFSALKNDGLFYNTDFKGKIPGLATTDNKNEDTAIYLLQTLYDLERLREHTAAFIDAGGYRLTERMPKPTERGTLVHTGFYMGGTRWKELQVATIRIENGEIQFKRPRQKNWRTYYDGPSCYLFMPNR